MALINIFLPWALPTGLMVSVPASQARGLKNVWSSLSFVWKIRNTLLVSNSGNGDWNFGVLTYITQLNSHLAGLGSSRSVEVFYCSPVLIIIYC